MASGRAQAVEQQFDNDSGDYLSKHLTPENISEQRRILKFIERKGDVETLLDIGCGPGTMTKQLSDLGPQVWGLDISADMIEYARTCWREKETTGEVVFEVGNAENLRFDTGYFDAVVAVGVLRYLESLEKGLEEIYRVLKPNGIMVVTFYYRFSLHWFVMCLFYRPLLPFISIVKGRSVRDCMLKYRAEPLPFSFGTFKRLFRKIGFKNMEVQHSGFDVFPFNRLFPTTSRRLYLKLEASLFDSHKLGWLGSICIVKGVK